MARLAQEPHTEVLEYAYEEAERGATTTVCVGMARAVVEARRALPADMSAKAARASICKDALLAQFSRTHPQIFTSMLDTATCGQALAMLEKLARVRQQIDANEMSEAEGNVHANRLIMEQTMRTPTAEERDKLELS